MATKIRLQRHGKKGYPFYHIVVADSRAKRDGRFIEKLGTYNPNTNPATIDLNFESTLKWVGVGAEMSDTARAILSYKGVLYKNHLLKGVKKGALTEAEAEKKFETWLNEKESKISQKSVGYIDSKRKEQADKLALEKAVNEERAKVLAAKNKPEEEVIEEPAEASAEESSPAVAEENSSDETAEDSNVENTEETKEQG